MAAPERRGGRPAKGLHFRQRGEEGLSGCRDVVCFPQGDATTQCYKHSQTLHSSSSLSLWFTWLIPCGPQVTLHDEHPQPHATLDPCLLRLCACVCALGRGRKGEGSVCGLCCGVCHLLSHNTLGIVSVFVCVCGKRAGSYGTYPVRMLCYYLSYGGYESHGMVSGKRERLPHQ